MKEEVPTTKLEILSVYASKPDTVILTTAKGELMSFNVISRHLEDMDQFDDEADDPTLKHQFEQLMHEHERSIDSSESGNIYLRCDYVFMDCSQNIFLIRGGSLLIYKPTKECEVLIEKLPESTRH